MTLQRRHIVIGVAVALVAVIAITLLVHSLGDAKTKKADETPQRVAPVVVVARGSLENIITLTGEFRPFQQVDVHAKVAGYVRRIFVDVGDKVSTGQVLAILEVPELNAQVMGAHGSPRFRVRTPAAQFAKNRKSRINMPKPIYQIRSLCPQLRHKARQSL